jgi:hypothetical protein
VPAQLERPRHSLVVFTIPVNRRLRRTPSGEAVA